MRNLTRQPIDAKAAVLLRQTRLPRITSIAAHTERCLGFAAVLDRLVPKEIDYLFSRLARAALGRESLAPLWSRGGDPRVMRLVESAAYYFARVREKLEDDVPEIAHAIVARALPETLRPTPSATIVQIRDIATARLRVMEEPVLRVSSAPVDGVPCTFETAWPIVTAPVRLERATVSAIEDGVHALTLRLTAYRGMDLGVVLPDALRLFIRTGDPTHALDLVHALHASTKTPRVRWLDAHGLPVQTETDRGPSIRWTALDNPPRLRGTRSDRFASGSALRTLFSFPEAFAFIDVVGLSRFRGARALGHVLELTFELARPVRPSLFDAQYELDCAPAYNVFPTSVTVNVTPLGNCEPIAIPDRPGAEVFAIHEASFSSSADPDHAEPVLFWEEQAPPHAYLAEDRYLRMERREPLPGRGVEVRPIIVRPAGPLDVRDRGGRLHLNLLATDGPRTEKLGPGYVAQEGDTSRLVNITRVTPPRSCVLSEQVPWRLNAYARMTLPQFATRRSLTAYLRLHDPSAKGAAAATSGLIAVKRTSVRRVSGTEVHHGDEVDIQLDETAFGGRGATWLVGHFLAGALAERTDMLRYVRTRWVNADGTAEADYGIINGTRLPPPFG